LREQYHQQWGIRPAINNGQVDELDLINESLVKHMPVGRRTTCNHQFLHAEFLKEDVSSVTGARHVFFVFAKNPPQRPTAFSLPSRCRNTEQLANS